MCGGGGGGGGVLHDAAYGTQSTPSMPMTTTAGWVYRIIPEDRVTAQLVYGTVVTVSVSPVLASLGFDLSLVCIFRAISWWGSRTHRRYRRSSKRYV